MATSSPPKGKKGSGGSSIMSTAGQQTPPAGMPPMGPGGFPLGPPGQVKKNPNLVLNLF